MQDRVLVQNQGMRADRVRARARDRIGLRRHLRGQGLRLRARRPAARAPRCRRRSRHASTRSTTSSCSRTQSGLPGADAGDPLAARRASTDGAGHATGSSSSRASAGTCGSTSSRLADGEQIAPQAGRAPLRRRDRPRSRLARGLAAARAAAARDAGTTSRSRSASSVADLAVAAHARHGRRRRQAAGRRHAVVHDRLRPGHDHHVPPDAALRARARRDGAPGARASSRRREDDPAIDAEPGKIVHEVRQRQGRAQPGSPPTTARSTRRRSTSSCSRRSGAGRTTRRSSASCRSRRLRALEWIDDARRPRRRRLRRVLSGAPSAGSRTSRGRTRATRSASPTGASREPPIAPCEVQGYVYDAKRRMAELAREVWRDRELAERLEREADELTRPLQRGVLDRASAAATTRSRSTATSSRSTRSARTSATCSGAGSSRPSASTRSSTSSWATRSGRAGACGRCRPPTRGYNPLAYHNGTVWPHDNSLIAWGLARYGRWPEAHRIVRRMLERGAHFDHQLPEVFAGLPRTETPFPIAYPTAARPQAWAAGTPVLLLQLLLGLEPDRRQQHARDGRACRAAGVGRIAQTRRECAPSTASGTSGSRTGEVSGDRRHERRALADRRRQPGVVPGAAVGLRRHRVDRVAARRRPRRRGPRRHALRLGRLADEGEARVRLRGGAEPVDRAVALGAASRARLLHERRRVRRHQRPHRACPASSLSGLVETPVVHTVHGPLDGEPGDDLRAARPASCPTST